MLVKSIIKRCKFLIILALFSSALVAKPNVIIDADTANEVDDLYALAAAFIDPTWNVVALNATQWQTSQWATSNTMEDSHRLNQKLLSLLQVQVPTKRGGAARMYDWGDMAQHSAAAYEIIKQAKQVEKGEKLIVIALGALTNVASALFIEPSIVDNISVYWLGTQYDFDKKILAHNDFNPMMDIQAFHIVYQSKVELHVMPVSVAVDMQFNYAQTAEVLLGKHPLTDILVNRWRDHVDGAYPSRAIWDLALISVMLNPQWATTQVITTDPYLGAGKVTYYKSINAQAIKDDFFSDLLAYIETL